MLVAMVVRMRMARAVGMGVLMLVGMILLSIHDGLLAGLQVGDFYRAIAGASAVSAHQAASSNSIVFMLSSSPLRRVLSCEPHGHSV